MPYLNSAQLGPVEFAEEDVLSFPLGLPGFPDHRRFVLIRKDPSLLAYLQSVDFPDIRFILVPVSATAPDYSVSIETGDLSILFPDHEPQQQAEMSLYFVVSARDHAEPRINMLAPIVIRPSKRIGLQAIRADSTYSHTALLSDILNPVNTNGISRC